MVLLPDVPQMLQHVLILQLNGPDKPDADKHDLLLSGAVQMGALGNIENIVLFHQVGLSVHHKPCRAGADIAQHAVGDLKGVAHPFLGKAVLIDI